MIIDFTDLKKAADDLSGFVNTLKTRRQTTEQEWLEAHDAWKAKFTKSFFKSEIFNHYVPSFRRAIEKFAVRGAQMVLPSNDFFEVFPGDELSDENGAEAESVRAYLYYIVTKRIRIYSLAKQLFRTYALYGRSIIKTGVKIYVEDSKERVWPFVRTVDPFQWYIWPETAPSIEEASVLVEDSIIAWDTYKSYVDGKQADPLEKSELTGVTWPVNLTQRLSQSGVPEPTTTAPQSSAQDEKKKRTDSDFVQLSEVWINHGDHWRFCWIVWNVSGGPKIVRVNKKKLARPFYRMTVAREIPGEHYTSQMGSDLVNAQILLNDSVNLYMESSAMEMAGPVAIDPMQVHRTSSLTFRPRAKWLVPPTAVRQVYEGASNATRAALSFAQFSFGLMDTFSGAGPLTEGQTMRNMPRAGFAVSSMMSMALSEIRDAAKSIEDDLLTPMLKDLYALTVEYVPEKQVLRIPGSRNFPARTMNSKSLEGDWDFNWIGSLQGEAYQEEAQRLQGMLEVMAKLMPFLGPELQAQGKRINWTAISKRIWRQAVGSRGSESMIESVPPAAPVGPAAEGGEALTSEDMQALMEQMQQMGDGASPEMLPGSEGVF